MLVVYTYIRVYIYIYKCLELPAGHHQNLDIFIVISWDLALKIDITGDVLPTIKLGDGQPGCCTFTSICISI